MTSTLGGSSSASASSFLDSVVVVAPEIDPKVAPEMDPKVVLPVPKENPDLVSVPELFSEEVPNENAFLVVSVVVLPNENPVDGLTDSSDFVVPNVNPEFFEFEFSFSDSVVDPNVNPEVGLSFEDDPNENPVVTVFEGSTVFSLDFEFSLEPKENPVLE